MRIGSVGPLVVGRLLLKFENYPNEKTLIILVLCTFIK